MQLLKKCLESLYLARIPLTNLWLVAYPSAVMSIPLPFCLAMVSVSLVVGVGSGMLRKPIRGNENRRDNIIFIGI